MPKIKNAVILVAGLGARLRPLTVDAPKCLTEVKGIPILEHTLISLGKNGIEEAAVVVGYLGKNVVDRFGKRYGSIRLTYLWNKVYDETNSMYSAWIARKYLEKGAFLIEGDTVFEDAIIKRLAGTSEAKTCWAADKFTREHDGCMLILDKTGRIIDLKIVRGKLKDYRDNYYKSSGILKISPVYGKLFSKWLDDDVRTGNTGIYYDLVIKKHLKDYPIHVCDITGNNWVEIDNIDDLKKTENIFMPMKHVVITVDGAASPPMHESELMLRQGAGLMQTKYPGLPCASAAVNLGILGYNPLRYYPNGFASFEALARDIYLQEDEIAFRCDPVSFKNGRLEDPTGNNISVKDAGDIIRNAGFIKGGIRFYAGDGCRNILIAKAPYCNVCDISSPTPYMSIGRKIDELLMKSYSQKSRALIEDMNKLMLRSIVELGKLTGRSKTGADMFLLWNPSSEPRLPSFRGKYGIDGVIVSETDYMRGIAIAARMESRKVPSAAGCIGGKLEIELKSAVDSLRYNDLVFIHLNITGEESRNRNMRGKDKIIKMLDHQMIGPVKKHLEGNYNGRYRLAVLLNNPAADFSPFIIYRCGRQNDTTRFLEKNISRRGRLIIKSYEFMDFFTEKER